MPRNVVSGVLLRRKGDIVCLLNGLSDRGFIGPVGGHGPFSGIFDDGECEFGIEYGPEKADLPAVHIQFMCFGVREVAGRFFGSGLFQGGTAFLQDLQAFVIGHHHLISLQC